MSNFYFRDKEGAFRKPITYDLVYNSLVDEQNIQSPFGSIALSCMDGRTSRVPEFYIHDLGEIALTYSNRDTNECWLSKMTSLQGRSITAYDHVHVQWIIDESNLVSTEFAGDLVESFLAKDGVLAKNGFWIDFPMDTIGE